MDVFGPLLIGLLPLALVAAVSPVIALNAESVVYTEGPQGGWRFVAGNAAVLALVGTVFVGVLGSSASTFATREAASQGVDRALGVVLLVFAGHQLWVRHRTERKRAAVSRATTRPHERSAFAWGILGMATNFSTLPVFVSIGQRIGAAGMDWPARFLLLALLGIVVLVPAWLPVVFSGRRGGGLSASTRARVASITAEITVAACLAGALALLWHSR